MEKVTRNNKKSKLQEDVTLHWRQTKCIQSKFRIIWNPYELYYMGFTWNIREYHQIMSSLISTITSHGYFVIPYDESRGSDVSIWLKILKILIFFNVCYRLYTSSQIWQHKLFNSFFFNKIWNGFFQIGFFTNFCDGFCQDF